MGICIDVCIAQKQKVVSKEATFFVLALDKKICYIFYQTEIIYLKIQLWK